MLRRLLKPFVRRTRWVLWFVATVILFVWLAELVWLRQPGFVAKWLVPGALAAVLLTWLLQRKFWRLREPQDRETKIVIIGAGPAGLSAAYFLKEQGYREVLVLEKLGRVGGLCRTITEDYYNFDLGANYVTPAYKETLSLADEVGAELYVERPIMTIDFAEDPPEFVKPWQAVRQGTSGPKYIWLCLKYLWLRFWLGWIINPPGHARIHLYPELCVSFMAWLERHRLERLQMLFEAPITVMGYGYLHEIPAPYALKYMNVRTFTALALKAFPLTSWFYPWPKRFVLGFQRLWEAVSWNLNVRFNVKIHSITRRDGKVIVDFSHEEQVLNQTEPHRDTMEFHKLILACPLTPDVLSFLDATDEERTIFDEIVTYSYCLTSFTTGGIQMDRPIAAALPLPEMGMPWAITKQMEESNLFQFYSRVPEEWEWDDLEDDVDFVSDSECLAADSKEDRDPVRRRVVGKVREVVRRLGGTIADDQWHTFDRWPYFQHVSATHMRDGYYKRLEKLQGTRNTYYVGALMNFELVESCIEYSKHLVRTKFDRV